MPKDEFHKRRTQPGLYEELPGFGEPSNIPKMIGPYKIECLLETGGMSVLYLGVHPNTNEVTTIKVLLPKFLSHPEIVQRFLKEAEIIAMTDHPNIVKLYGHGEWEGGLYIAMEFIQGTSLRQTLLQRPISLKRALEIVIDIAYALCHLHTHGVIHRDLKPENVLITESGEVKVIDFGIAQLLTERGPESDLPAQRIIGTPIYMSPEQKENPETVSYPSDIYSLGIITYELVLGKLCHGIVHISLMPKGLQKILSKALQPNPQQRYCDIVDFITDISTYLNSTNLEKEKKPGDQLSEISEDLCNIQEILIPSSSPEWPEIEVYSGCVRGVNIFGIYYDFFCFPDGTYGIVMSESLAKGAEGVIFAAMLRGMVQSLVKQKTKPVEFIEALNKLVTSDKKAGVFTLGYLLLKPKDKQIEYISCGKTSLWKILPTSSPVKITSDNAALGADEGTLFTQVSTSWQVGDGLVFSSFIADSTEENVKDFFDRALQENKGELVPKKFIDAVLRKAKLSLAKSLQERPLSLIALVFRLE
ncbi:MAG: protein kinase [Parachlamydiaceae bacterium]